MTKLLQLLILLITANYLYGQNVGINTATPDSSAILDLFANDKGLLIPRVNLTDANSNIAPIDQPATGLLVYNTNPSILNGDGVGFYYFDGTVWTRLLAGTIANDLDWTYVGNDIYNNNTGNVGIGLINPSGKLTVFGNNRNDLTLQTSDNISSNGLAFQNAGGAYTWSVYRNDAGNNAADFRIAGNTASGPETLTSSLIDYLTIEAGGQVGIGTTTPDAELHVVQPAGGPSKILIESNSLALLQLNDNRNNALYNIELGRNATAGDLTFRSNSGEQMRLTALGNLGIGTTNPQEKLHVGGAIRMVDGSQQNGYVITGDANGTMQWTHPDSLGVTGDNLGDHGATQDIRLNGNHLTNNGSNGIRITNDGWIGINRNPRGLLDFAQVGAQAGVLLPQVALLFTSSASPLSIGAVDNGEIVYNTANQNDVSPGYYYWQNGSWHRMEQDNLGDHTATENIQLNGNWLSNDGGNEGISITNNGNVGIATQSPGGKLQVNNSSTDYMLYNNSGLSVYGAENSSGEVRLGAAWSRPGVYAENGLNLYTAQNQDISFGNNNTEYVKINAQGKLLVGSTVSNDFSFGVRRDVSTASSEDEFVASFQNLTNPSGAFSHGVEIYAGQSSHNRNSRFISFKKPCPSGCIGTEIGSIRQSSSNDVNYANNSDIRLKTNIKPTQYGIADLMKVQVADYVFKNKPDEQHTGFLAQQLHSIYPYPVSTGGDDPNVAPWAVDYGKITPLLVKAIQDQQAQIEALEETVRLLKK